jgi:hypothetical protein
VLFHCSYCAVCCALTASLSRRVRTQELAALREHPNACRIFSTEVAPLAHASLAFSSKLAGLGGVRTLDLFEALATALLGRSETNRIVAGAFVFSATESSVRTGDAVGLPGPVGGLSGGDSEPSSSLTLISLLCHYRLTASPPVRAYTAILSPHY